MCILSILIIICRPLLKSHNLEFMTNWVFLRQHFFYRIVSQWQKSIGESLDFSLFFICFIASLLRRSYNFNFFLQILYLLLFLLRSYLTPSDCLKSFGNVRIKICFILRYLRLNTNCLVSVFFIQNCKSFKVKDNFN